MLRLIFDDIFRDIKKDKDGNPIITLLEIGNLYEAASQNLFETNVDIAEQKVSGLEKSHRMLEKRKLILETKRLEDQMRKNEELQRKTDESPSLSRRGSPSRPVSGMESNITSNRSPIASGGIKNQSTFNIKVQSQAPIQDTSLIEQALEPTLI